MYTYLVKQIIRHSPPHTHRIIWDRLERCTGGKWSIHTSKHHSDNQPVTKPGAPLQDILFEAVNTILGGSKTASSILCI